MISVVKTASFTNKLILMWGCCSLMISAFLSSCTENTEPPDNTESEIRFEVPAHFPSPVYAAERNPTNTAGFELGRRLFYDPILSRDSTISCGSCHAQVHAFADHNIRVSIGIENKLGTRNSPGLFNLAWFPNFMWDGGINHIEVMSLGPIGNPLEMDEDISRIIPKLQRHPEYPSRFKQAFSDGEVNDKNMLLALAQFMRMMVSDGSKYDQVVRGKQTFTVEENRGYEIFKTHCSSCHQEPLFTDFSYRNNGLDSLFSDEGRKLITGKLDDLGKFKVPSLRNLEMTYPYMHDGRLNNLDEVLRHYSSEIKSSETLDPALKNGIPLTAEDRSALKAFLNTLNDYQYLSKHHLSEPKLP